MVSRTRIMWPSPIEMMTVLAGRLLLRATTVPPMRPHPVEVFWQWRKFAALVAGKAQLASGPLGIGAPADIGAKVANPYRDLQREVG